ncbi:MAG: aminopeptidase [Ignavibacteria bacterium]|jgi:bleomycin hydrolase|nr:aminopeptidase [Ignavibacteria bacterium]
MKQIIIAALILIVSLNVDCLAKPQAKDTAKKADLYIFTDVKVVPTTAIKNQNKSGTCWSFSGLGFIESELLRLGKGEYDLSEMFVVRKNYEDKAKKYVRYHGNINFAGGGAFHDVISVIKNYGILPEDAYRGIEYAEEKHIHGELDAVLKANVDAVMQNQNSTKKLSPVWFSAYCSIMDAYLGVVPENFVYNGITYTPQSFAKSLGLNSDDYVSVGSFTHHPFYEKFILEIPDNWAMEEINNVKIDELMEIIDNAINNGYTVAWGADVSESGFKRNECIAYLPDENRPDLTGEQRAEWNKLSDKQKDSVLFAFEKKLPEKIITQEFRQIGFDNYQTTDDHGMIICGIAKDQDGNKFYKIKNSWGTTYKYNGFWYVSESFVKYKTIDIAVHKDAIPQKIKSELKIN